jgi:hypothetical protein
MLHLGDDALAHALQAESVALCREVGNRWLLVGGLHSLAVAASAQEEWNRALLQESLAIARELGHRWGIAANLSVLGGMAQERGDTAAARPLWEECLALRREIGHQEGIARALLCLGINALDRGDLDGARSFFEESLVGYRELGLKERTAVCLDGMARVAGAKGQPGRAAQLLGAVESLCAVLGRPPDWPLAVYADLEGHVASVRAALDEEAFAAAWAAGQAMSLEDATLYALQEFADEEPSRPIAAVEPQ